MFISDDLDSLKLIDFGVSGVMDDNFVHKKCGTAYYVAPEIMRGEIYSEKIDIWSLGVIIHVLLTGKPLICGSSVNSILK